MPTRKIYHVVPHPSGWAVKIDKARRASAVLKTKDAAMKTASNLARSAPKSQVVIRESSGKIKGDRTFEYRDYKKKKRVRTKISKIKKPGSATHVAINAPASNAARPPCLASPV